MNTARSALIIMALVLLVLLGASFLTGGPRSQVDWKAVRAVAFESDDWGLAGFSPSAAAWEGLDRSRLDTGRFPEIYWLSTLESGQDVRALNGVLASFLDRGGHPAVLQPNYIMSSLEHVGDRWVARDLPALPGAYARPGLWDEVASAVRAGTWYPELHGSWHYDPEMRRAAALADDLAREVTARGIMLFPGSERARELGTWRSLDELQAELDHSLEVFQAMFGRPPGSVIAPDYTWSGRIESLWSARDLKVIQGKREQINPDWGQGYPGRLAKYLGRHWDKWRHPDRFYLERNCRLETGQAADPEEAVRRCAADTRRAWATGQPAIVETHRVNFVHLDPAVSSAGRQALSSYLAEVTGAEGPRPTFLTGVEIAQLSARGTSWCVRGDKVVVRNATRARRIVAVPAQALARARGERAASAREGADRLVAVPAGTTVDLVP